MLITVPYIRVESEIRDSFLFNFGSFNLWVPKALIDKKDDATVTIQKSFALSNGLKESDK